MRTLATADALDLVDHGITLKLLVVDKAFCAVLIQKLLLIGTGIDTNDTQPDGGSVLDREMACGSAGEGDELLQLPLLTAKDSSPSPPPAPETTHHAPGMQFA